MRSLSVTYVDELNKLAHAQSHQDGNPDHNQSAGQHGHSHHHRYTE